MILSSVPTFGKTLHIKIEATLNPQPQYAISGLLAPAAAMTPDFAVIQWHDLNSWIQLGIPMVIQCLILLKSEARCLIGVLWVMAWLLSRSWHRVYLATLDHQLGNGAQAVEYLRDTKRGMPKMSGYPDNDLIFGPD